MVRVCEYFEAAQTHKTSRHNKLWDGYGSERAAVEAIHAYFLSAPPRSWLGSEYHLHVRSFFRREFVSEGVVAGAGNVVNGVLSEDAVARGAC